MEPDAEQIMRGGMAKTPRLSPMSSRSSTAVINPLCGLVCLAHFAFGLEEVAHSPVISIFRVATAIPSGLVHVCGAQLAVR